MTQQSLSEQVNQRATVQGVARDAHAGAVVLTEDRTPVYIAGLSEWAGGLSGQPVAVSGVLRRRSVAPTPQVGADGGISHGIEGDSWVIEDATWTAGT